MFGTLLSPISYVHVHVLKVGWVRCQSLKYTNWICNIWVLILKARAFFPNFTQLGCKDIRLTLDIAETPSKAYTTFDTSPSPLWDMTWIATALNDPSGIQVIDSNREIRPTSKKPKNLKNKSKNQYVSPKY